MRVRVAVECWLLLLSSLSLQRDIGIVIFGLCLSLLEL